MRQICNIWRRCLFKAYFGFTDSSNSRTNHNILDLLLFKVPQLYALLLFALNYFYKNKDNRIDMDQEKKVEQTNQPKPVQEYIEAAYALSNKSTCRRCNQKIAKETVRLSYNFNKGKYFTTQWYHLQCFQLKPKFVDIDFQEEVEHLDYLDDNGGQDYTGTLNYLEQERERIKKGLPKVFNNESSKDEGASQEDDAKKKSKKDTKNEKQKKKKIIIKPAYSSQQQEKFDQLIQQYSSLTSQQLKEMLALNMQAKTGTKSQLIEKCADGKILGKIPFCPSCGGGRPKFNRETATYKCPGYMDDDKYRHCHKTFQMQEIKRQQWVQK